MTHVHPSFEWANAKQLPRPPTTAETLSCVGGHGVSPQLFIYPGIFMGVCVCVSVAALFVSGALLYFISFLCIFWSLCFHISFFSQNCFYYYDYFAPTHSAACCENDTKVSSRTAVPTTNTIAGHHLELEMVKRHAPCRVLQLWPFRGFLCERVPCIGGGE